MVIRYEYHLMNIKLDGNDRYKAFLILISDGSIKYTMIHSLHNIGDSVTTLNVKKLSEKVLNKIEDEFQLYELAVIAKEDEEDNEQQFDNKVVKMSVSFFEDEEDNETSDNTLNYDGTQKAMENSKVAIIIKDFVEWLGECLSIDDIELSYNRLKIDNRVIDCSD